MPRRANPPDLSTIHALRRDLALQIARHAERNWSTQLAAAKDLGIPQPTLSRIVNGQVWELSIELLIRIAVRARLPVILQTGTEPAEAGVFAAAGAGPGRVVRSRIADEAREAVGAGAQRLTPEQRLDAFLRHSELVTALHRAGQVRCAGPTARRKKGRAR